MLIESTNSKATRAATSRLFFLSGVYIAIIESFSLSFFYIFDKKKKNLKTRKIIIY